MTTLNNKMNATTEIKNAITRTPTTVVSTTETRVSKTHQELSQSNEAFITDDTVISGVVCNRCGLTLEDHTAKEHLDITCPVHRCEGGHKKKNDDPTTVVSTTETRVSKSHQELSQSYYDAIQYCGKKNCKGGRAFEVKDEMFCSPACANKHFNLKEGDEDFWEEEEEEEEEESEEDNDEPLNWEQKLCSCERGGGACGWVGCCERELKCLFAQEEEEEKDRQREFDELLDGFCKDLTVKLKAIDRHIAAIDEYHAPKEDCGKCCLCKGLMSNKWGNNPAPLRKRGKCCDKCNAEKVIPARMGNIDGGKSILGTHEEQVLQAKLFLLMGEEMTGFLEPMWEQNYAPFNKIKREYRDLVIARGMFPNIDWRKKSISFTPIAEMMKDEWDKQNLIYPTTESNDPN